MDWGTCHTTATAQVNELKVKVCKIFTCTNVFLLTTSHTRSLYTSTFPFQAATIVNSGPTSVLCPTLLSSQKISSTVRYPTCARKKQVAPFVPNPPFYNSVKRIFRPLFVSCSAINTGDGFPLASRCDNSCDSTNVSWASFLVSKSFNCTNFLDTSLRS